jgi:alpha-1,6-mannosyltransferase
VVAFFHSDVPRLLQQRLGSWIGPLARAYLRGVYSGFDLVLAPSHAMIESLEASGIQNAALLPLGVDTQVFHPARRCSEFRRELGVSDETRLLIYAGRFAREKNLPVLIRAAEKLGEPYHLVLVGGNARAQLARNATVLPYETEPARLARALASCDALVHAGDQETFGLIAIEAMACGLPVVVVGVGCIRELVDTTVGELIDRPDAQQMAAAVDALFRRDRAQIGAEARARILRSYSWNIAFRRLMQTYGRLAGWQTRQGALLARTDP